LEVAAESLKLTLQRVVSREASALEDAFATIRRDHADAVVVPTNTWSLASGRPIIEFANDNRLPLVSGFKEYPEDGSLMSYGSDRADRFRRAAIYVGKILKGEKPADLPVEEPTEYELVINLKTARSQSRDPTFAVADRRRGDRMRRREFMVGLGSASIGWSMPALAQKSTAIAKIGFLGAYSLDTHAQRIQAFQAGLRDLGYIDGQNVQVEFRWAEGNYSRLSELAAELLQLNVDVLVTHGTPGTLAAKNASNTTPIVMAATGDAVATGIVASLASPGGNITGSTFFDPELIAKRIELAKEAIPSIKKMSFLFNDANLFDRIFLKAAENAAASMRFEIMPIPARTLNDVSVALTAIDGNAKAAATTDDALFYSYASAIAAAAAAGRVALFGFTELTQSGGLIGYSANIVALNRRAAVFVDKILKGAKPSDLPVERPTKFELTINLQTARAIGIEVPALLLARADEIIE
jgi:putative tryptophan/tyrosine transport system substrate-binding protein